MSPGAVSASRWSRTRWPPPFRQAEFDIMFAEGISNRARSSIWEWRSAWWRRPAPGTPIKGERLGQGREAVRDFSRPIRPSPRKSKGKVRELAGLPSRGAGQEGQAKGDEKPERKVESRQDDKRGHKCERHHRERMPAGRGERRRGVADGFPTMAIRYLARAERTASPGDNISGEKGEPGAGARGCPRLERRVSQRPGLCHPLGGSQAPRHPMGRERLKLEPSSGFEEPVAGRALRPTGRCPNRNWHSRRSKVARRERVHTMGEIFAATRV